MRMTNQRRVIASVLEKADDHPDVEELYARVSREDSSISIATVYRTVKLFEEAGILDKHEFGDGRARYEDADRDHHDHLIDIDTGFGGAFSIGRTIKEMIAAENPAKPLSDNKIAALLAEKGIQVARRTVAKYRESINIPSSSQRKRFANGA